MAPNKTSSMLGWVAAVTETESPSQPRPAVIQSMCTSATGDGFCVTRPYGTVSAAITAFSFSGSARQERRLISISACAGAPIRIPESQSQMGGIRINNVGDANKREHHFFTLGEQL